MKKSDAKKNVKTNNLAYFIAAIVVLTLIFFGLGVLLNKSKEAETVSYNNFEFVKGVNGFWKVEVVVSTPEGNKLYNLETRYNPTELEGISVDKGVMDFFKDADGKDINAIYLTISPNSNNNSALALAGYDLSLNLARVFGVSIEAACTANLTDACHDRPIINCNDTYPVIYLKDYPIEQITYEPHRCIVISGKDVGMVKSVDRLLFQWYGIMY